jgi:hypothetical protein
MPTLHEEKDEYIYKAIYNGIYKLENSQYFEDGPYYLWDETEKIYKYANSKFPNKAYTKSYDPKTLYSRGDVIHFGNSDYRNENKMIFDGEKLKSLWTKVDDYGSVPPDFVCGDADGDFNIGDFEHLIDHNSINWLSKEKLKEVELYLKDNDIMGKVEIKGKKWKIHFEIHDDTEFNTGYSQWGSRKYKCVIDENENIVINKITNNKISNTKYILNTIDEDKNENFKDLIKTNSNISIIQNAGYGKPITFTWYLFKINKEYKLIDNENENKMKNINDIVFPIIWQKRTQHYTSENLFFDLEVYNKYIKHDEKELDKIYIQEVTGFPIKITEAKKDINQQIESLKEYFNSLVENYDNILKNRHPVNKIGNSSLEMYL